MTFSLTEFITESNLIDKQPNYDNTYIIPGDKPGDPMYDNMLDAYNLAIDIVKESPLNANHILDIHRALTKNIDFFEYKGMSGKWRTMNVCLHHNGKVINFAPVYLLHWMMHDIWTPFYADCITESHEASEERKQQMAFEIHDLFECIHPFIDGNGRTGRIILNAARIQMGLEPICIYYDHREKYYAKINDFRFALHDAIVSKYNKHQADL